MREPPEENARISLAAAQAEEVYNSLKRFAGPVSDALNTAADRIAKGETPDVVKAAAYQTIRTEIQSAIPGREGEGLGYAEVPPTAAPGLFDKAKDAASPTRPESSQSASSISEPAPSSGTPVVAGDVPPEFTATTSEGGTTLSARINLRSTQDIAEGRHAFPLTKRTLGFISEIPSRASPYEGWPC